MSIILSSLVRYVPTATPPAGTAGVALPADPAQRTARVYQVFTASTNEASLANGQTQQRYIHNPNTSGSFWIAFNGADPAVNGEGSFEVAPGGRWADAILGEIRVLFTAAGAKITAYER